MGLMMSLDDLWQKYYTLTYNFPLQQVFESQVHSLEIYCVSSCFIKGSWYYCYWRQEGSEGWKKDVLILMWIFLFLCCWFCFVFFFFLNKAGSKDGENHSLQKGSGCVYICFLHILFPLLTFVVDHCKSHAADPALHCEALHCSLTTNEINLSLLTQSQSKSSFILSVNGKGSQQVLEVNWGAEYYTNWYEVW